MTKTKPLPTAVARKVAVQAEVDPRTVQRVVLGLPVRPLIADRIRRVLAAMNLALVLVVLVSACGYTSSPPASPDTGADGAGRAASTVPSSSPDAGRFPDSLVVPADTRPADALVVTTADATPDQQPDALAAQPDAVVELDAQPDTRIRPDTKLQPDSRLAPTCRWKHAQSGQTADVYAVDVDPSKACGTVPGNGSLCYVGCTVYSVVLSFEIVTLSPVGQPIDLADGSCAARILTDAASLPALCFAESSACAKVCQP